MERRHEVTLLRKAIPGDSSYSAVLEFAYHSNFIILTCNRDDFLHLAATKPHRGVLIVIRRRTRGKERAALLSLIERACESGPKHNINFA